VSTEQPVCGVHYGTGEARPFDMAVCERAEGHPPVSEDRIGHWGDGDLRFSTHPDRIFQPPRTLMTELEAASGSIARAVGYLAARPESEFDAEVLAQILANVRAIIELKDQPASGAARCVGPARLLLASVQEWAASQ
jgi:hypothetical protein